MRRLHGIGLLLGLHTLGRRRRHAAALLAALVAIGGLFADADRSAVAQELAPPRIWLEGDCGPVFTDDTPPPEFTITVHGHNFTPGAVIDLLSWDALGSEFPPPDASPQADAYGTFDQPITVRQPRSPGLHEVRAYDQAQPSVQIAVVTFEAPCKGTVTVDPPCADVPPAGEQISIRVTGSGWSDIEGFAVRFLSFDGTALDEVSATVTNGSFDVTLQPPNPILRAPPPLAPGIYAIVVVTVQVPSAVVLFPLPCTQPRVDLQADCGPAGAPPEKYALQIAGRGFMPYPGGRTPVIGPSRAPGHVEILFDVGFKRQEYVYPGGINPDGSWGPVPVDPYLRPDGSYTVRVRQYVAGYVLLETTTSFTVPCDPPRIELDPVCGPPGFDGEGERRDELTVRGFNFAPGEATVTFDALGQVGLSPELAVVEVAPDGTFTAEMSPIARPPGTYEVHAGQDPPREGLPVVALFTVPCEPPKTPELTARCDPEEPEPPDAGEVLIRGRGFFESAPLFLVVGTAAPELLTTDDAGRFERRVPAAGLPTGALTVVATQRDKALVTVAEATTAAALPCGTPAAPMIRIVPETVSPGFVVMVEGAFFEPGQQVTLRWDRGIGAGVALPVEADAAGVFRVQVLIYHHDFGGEREMTATRANDDAAVLGEPASLLVVPGRGSPPAFVVNGEQGPIVIRR